MLDWLKRDSPVLEVGGRELPVVLRRLAHARRMTLRLAPDGSEIRISVPRWCRTAEAMAFARDRRDWLETQLAALPRAEPIGPDATIRYRGAALRLDYRPAAPRKPVPADAAITIGGPAESLRPRLMRWLKGEAQTLAEQDLAFYCERIDRAAPPIALSNAQRRWGSCAPDGTIRINWRLVMAPDFVRRSVVAHEASHLVHFDHSPRFHALLADLYEGDIAQANRWLKREGRTLYAPFG